MSSNKHFDDLPNEILLKIFTYLGLEDLAFSVQNVCVRWKDVSQDNKLWENIVFCPRIQLSDKQIVNHFKNMPALKSFCASRKASNYVIESLCKCCRNIRNIDLHSSQDLKSSVLEKICQAYPNIESLRLALPYGDATEQIKCMELIAHCRQLSSLTLKDNGEQLFMSMEGILSPVINGCPTLQHFHIGDYGMVDANLLLLLERKKHHLLSFSCKIVVTKELSEKLGECTKLQYLDLVNLNEYMMLYSDVEPLTKLRTLKHFALRFCSEYVIDDLPSFFLSGSFSQVVYLDLSESYFMNDLVVNTVCKNCPHLKCFFLCGSQSLHNEGLKFIGCCKQLEFLDVSMSMDLTDGSMEYVGAGCSNLKYLDITGCYKMTDKVIEHIVKCKQLRVLKFNYNDLTGSNFHLISSHLHQLVELHVESCKYLGEVFIDVLHKKMPNLKIVIARKYKQAYHDHPEEAVLVFD